MEGGREGGVCVYLQCLYFAAISCSYDMTLCVVGTPIMVMVSGIVAGVKEVTMVSIDEIGLSCK